MVAFQEVDLLNLSYNELQSLAKVHNVYKQGSKKKAALVQRLLELNHKKMCVLPQIEECADAEEFSGHNDDKLPSFEEFTSKCNRRSTSYKAHLPSEESESDRRSTFVVEENAEETTKPKKRGRRAKAKAVSEDENIDPSNQNTNDRRGTFTVDEVNEPKRRGRKPRNTGSESEAKASEDNISKTKAEAKTEEQSTPVVNNVTIVLNAVPSDRRGTFNIPNPSAPKTPNNAASVNTPSKSVRKSAVKKVPNFKAIHQKQFEKMENLKEFWDRKAQRARFLMSPSIPSKPSSIPVKVNKILHKPIVTRVKQSPLKPKPSTNVLVAKIQPPKKPSLVQRATVANKLKPVKTTEERLETTREVLKGVRSNKRFLLQMQARKLL